MQIPYSAFPLFQGIEETGITRLKACLRMRVYTYLPGERVEEMSAGIEHLGILIAGTAHMEMSDADGNCVRLAELRAGDVYSELFYLPPEEHFCSLEADEECRVLVLDWHSIVHPCSQSCAHHARLLENLFRLSAEKSRSFHLYTEILSHRSVRGRLLAYLEALARKEGSRTITLPMSLTALSTYLCVDRSTMMREIKTMREEGVLLAQRRSITLL